MLSYQKLADIGACGVQQLRELQEPVGSQVAQLSSMAILHWFIKAGQELEPLGRNPDHYHSSILGLPAVRDQAALFQAIKQAGNVPIPRNHSVGNLPTGQAF